MLLITVNCNIWCWCDIQWYYIHNKSPGIEKLVHPIAQAQHGAQKKSTLSPFRKDIILQIKFP